MLELGRESDDVVKSGDDACMPEALIPSLAEGGSNLRFRCSFQFRSRPHHRRPQVPSTSISRHFCVATTLAPDTPHHPLDGRSHRAESSISQAAWCRHFHHFTTHRPPNTLSSLAISSTIRIDSMSAWAEATAPDGRTYYWNKTTKVTSWSKPDDFEPPGTPATPATPAVPAGSASDWAEAQAADGRIYYYNKATQEVTWETPAVLREQQQQRSQPVGRPDFVAGGGHDFPRLGMDDRMSRRDERQNGLPQKPSFDGPRGGGGSHWESRQEGAGFRGPMPAKTDEPEYGTPEAAEEAFFKLLKRNNISPDTPWLDALKVVIRDREYRAIKDPRERKQAFEKYCQQAREQEKIREKERKERIRVEFRQMLSTHDDIKYYTRYKTALPIIEHEAIFKSAGDDVDRRRMFEEYILDLKRRHVEEEVTRWKTASAELDNMLKTLIIDPETRWADAEEIIMNSDRFVSDDIFKSLHKLEVFSAFDVHMKALDRIANDAIQREKSLRRRRQRQARDGFLALLDEKVQEGHIKAGSKWQDIHPLITTDERYNAYLGIPGSEPIELFWDIVEEEEHKLRSKRNDALDVLEEKRWEMTLETTLDEFVEVMLSHPRTDGLTRDEMSMIFDKLMDKVKRRHEDSKADAERQKSRTIDNIRSAMRKADPPIRLEDSFEEVAQRLEGHREFEDADQETRRSAYEKYMRRVKDRDETDRDRTRRDREKDRDRERDTRNGLRRDDRERDRDRRYRTRSPEIDAYEADRRKAQETRERQYRKASFGLTPPPRDRRDDRYDRDRRPERPDSMSIYDRERREREMERERSYISRADPRDKSKALDYGDEDAVGSRPGSIRKRRESDVSAASRRENKVRLH